MNEYVRDFLNYIIVERGFSQKTKEAYENDLNKFVSFLINKSIFDFTNINYETIVSFLTHLSQSGLGPESRNRYLGTLKAFFKFLRMNDFIDKNYVKYVCSAHTIEKIPIIFDLFEFELMINSTNPNNFIGVRDKLIMEFLFGTGLRASELLNLKIEDIHEDLLVVNHGKGAKDRIVPIGRKALEALNIYYSKYKREVKPTDLVFTTSKGRMISRNNLYFLIRKYAKKCGINKKISPHTFRHSYATYLLKGGADIRVIQELLGHSDINSTSIYFSLDIDQISESFKKYHNRYDHEK